MATSHGTLLTTVGAGCGPNYGNSYVNRGSVICPARAKAMGRRLGPATDDDKSI
jgi:hypothetical protein